MFPVSLDENMDQTQGGNSNSPQHGSGMVLEQNQYHHDGFTQEDLYNGHSLHVNTFSSPHGQDAYPLDGSHSWNPYLLPVGTSTASEYGLYYAPATLGISDDGNDFTVAGATGNETLFSSQHDSFPRSAAGMELYGQDTVGQQQFGDDAAMHHGQMLHRPSFCGYQEQLQAPLVSPSGWPSDQGHSDHTLVELQISREPTQPTDQHDKTMTTTKGVKRKSATTTTKRKRGKVEHEENGDPPAPATKRRGRKPKVKAVKPDSPDIAPLTIWAPKAENTNRELFTASPNSYASQSSQAPANSMSYTTGSTASSFDSNTAAHEAFVEMHHNDRKATFSHSDDGDRLHVHSINTFTPHTFSLSSSISSSPRPPPTPVTPSFPSFPSFSSSTYPPQQQPPYHQQQQQQQHRASFSGMPHTAAHLLQSQQLLRASSSRRQSTSSIDFTHFGDPTTLLLPKDQRARNRVAANKCRLKTKAAVTRLEEEERAASERHAELSRAAAALKDEVYVLRNQLLMHTDCDCTMIHKYLANTARDLANGMTGSVRPKITSRSSLSSIRRGGRGSNEDERADGGAEEDGSGETDDEAEDDEDVQENYLVKSSPGGARCSGNRSPKGIALDTLSSPATKVAAMEQIGKRAEKQRLQYLNRAMAMAGMVLVE